MHNRACFWKTFGSERVNESQKRKKSAEKYFTSILVLLDRIYYYQFISNYLKNHKIFDLFFFKFWNQH